VKNENDMQVSTDVNTDWKSEMKKEFDFKNNPESGINHSEENTDSIEDNPKDIVYPEINPNDTVKYMLISLVAVAAVMLVVGLFVSKAPIKFAIGLVFGTAVSAVRLLMLTRSVKMSLLMEPADAKTYMTGQSNMRMLLIIAAVVVGASMRSVLSIYGIAAGLIAFQPAAYLANIIYERMGGEKLDFTKPDAKSNDVKKADRHS
jgi:hypothetical protein